MTVTAEDRFEVAITLTITNNTTGKKTTETTHTDFELDYGSMQALRQVIVGSLNDSTGELGQTLAESFGQVSLRQILGNVAGKAVDVVANKPGIMR